MIEPVARYCHNLRCEHRAQVDRTIGASDELRWIGVKARAERAEWRQQLRTGHIPLRIGEGIASDDGEAIQVIKPRPPPGDLAGKLEKDRDPRAAFDTIERDKMPRLGGVVCLETDRGGGKADRQDHCRADRDPARKALVPRLVDPCDR